MQKEKRHIISELQAENKRLLGENHDLRDGIKLSEFRQLLNQSASDLEEIQEVLGAKDAKIADLKAQLEAAGVTIAELRAAVPQPASEPVSLPSSFDFEGLR